jgi:hypothetical protein
LNWSTAQVEPVRTTVVVVPAAFAELDMAPSPLLAVATFNVILVDRLAVDSRAPWHWPQSATVLLVETWLSDGNSTWDSAPVLGSATLLWQVVQVIGPNADEVALVLKLPDR